MKSFLLSEILLLSNLEKKARKVQFNPEMTIILGANDTGKSCLIKSIFSTFGAEPVKIHPNWKNAKVLSLVKFTIDNEPYSILKDGSFYSIFDGNNSLLKKCKSITNDLGPYLAQLFEFQIKINNRQGESVTLPPAYYFLPFYIDQDESWSRAWSAFSRLEQFAKWQQPISEYHTGIRPNEYYKLKGEKDKLETEIKQLDREISICQASIEKINQDLRKILFDINLNDFKEEIEDLLIVCQKLNKLEQEYQEKILSLKNQRTIVDYQIKIAENSFKEIKADFQYAVHSLTDDHIDCPTCGAIYENSFADRFSIAQDEQKCNQLIVDLKQEREKLDQEIEGLTTKFNKNHEDFTKVSQILHEKKAEIKLIDVILLEGRKEIARTFKKYIEDYTNQKSDKEAKLGDVNSTLRQLDNPDKKKEILDFYVEKMKHFLYSLSVNTLDESTYKKSVYSRITETGSDQPRALLAYYYSVLHTMSIYSSSIQCPIIIDSPNQQAQDKDSLGKMIKFIIKEKPKQSQLILALEDLHSISPNYGEVLNLTAKYSLLQREEYDPIKEEIDMYLAKIYNTDLATS